MQPQPPPIRLASFGFGLAALIALVLALGMVYQVGANGEPPVELPAELGIKRLRQSPVIRL